MLRTPVTTLENFWTGIAQIVVGDTPIYPDYRDTPVKFAHDFLGVQWTPEIQNIAQLLLEHQKVLVKAGHSVGKTHGVAGIALWWLSTRQTIVVTTAPTWRQVKDLIWRELRGQHRHALKTLPGKPTSTDWNVDDRWYATGISTNDPTRFQGYHSEELLVLLDEACGVEKFIWNAVEDSLVVSDGNRILAIGNPTDPTSRFAQASHSSDWKVVTLSCLDHPNVVTGRKIVKGAVSQRWVDERVRKWCIPFEELRGEEAVADKFVYKGKTYLPNDMFRVRILGEFPVEGGDQIFPLSFIEKAFKRDPLEPIGARHIGLDVARFGDDNSVLTLGTENGVVLKIDVWQGNRTTESTARAKWWVSYAGRVENIAVDEIGVGSGVVDELAEANYPVIGVNVAKKPYDDSAYTNLRDELTFLLADRFRQGTIDLTRATTFEETITEELSAYTFDYTPKGQRKVVSKADIKDKIGRSPDFADSLMLFFAFCESGFIRGTTVPKPKSESWDTL